MQTFPLTLVAGPPGAGKTTWIRQQLDGAERFAYLNLGADAVRIDATYLAAEVPELVVWSSWLPELADFTKYQTYIELDFHIDLGSLVLPTEFADCHRVAVLPPGIRQTEWHDWADVIVTGTETRVPLQPPQLWRSLLTGQVLDFASLTTVWDELINGAYGHVQRAKGIFEVTDGRSLYFDFVAGDPEPTSTELDLPRWLEGRPNRFSGVEVVGEQLDETAIAQTLKDCCLDDRTLAYYQQQVREFLEDG